MKQHAEKCVGNGMCMPGLEALSRGIPCNCDGYHSIPELYEHRYALWIALCKMLYADPQYQIGQKADVWRSKRHSDGELAFGGEWFLMGIGRNQGEQITYHLPISKWEETEFAETLEKAPEFDGHTSDDVLDRLKSI
jgi:hypothetical protein